MASGRRPPEMLEAVRERYLIVMHDVLMSTGLAGPLDRIVQPCSAAPWNYAAGLPGAHGKPARAVRVMRS